jgi:hypothetical protein
MLSPVRPLCHSLALSSWFIGIISLIPWPLVPELQSSQAFLLSLQHIVSFLCVTRTGSNPQSWESWAPCSVHRHVFGCRNTDMVDCRGVRSRIYDPRHRKSLQQRQTNPPESVPVYGCGANQDQTLYARKSAGYGFLNLTRVQQRKGSKPDSRNTAQYTTHDSVAYVR